MSDAIAPAAAQPIARDEDGLVYASLKQLLRLEQPSQQLSFSSRQPQGSILAGQHNSRLRGRGLNFEELRRYQPGDDLRHIDWRVSLRHGKPFVRSFSEERDRPALILVDQRMDMFFGSQRSMKSCTAAELAWVWFLPPLAAMAPFKLSGGEVTVLMGGWIVVWALLSRFQRGQQFWHDVWAGTRLIDVQPDLSRRRV